MDVVAFGNSGGGGGGCGRADSLNVGSNSGDDDDNSRDGSVNVGGDSGCGVVEEAVSFAASVLWNAINLHNSYRHRQYTYTRSHAHAPL